MNTSMTEISLLIMVDVLFISNFFFVRRLRSVVDMCVDNDASAFLNTIQRKFKEAPAVQGLQGFLTSYQRATRNNDEEQNRRGRILEIVYAVCLGRQKMASSISKRFPDWEPIPFKLGIVSTALLLLISSSLLSDNALTRELAISTQMHDRSDFCASADFDKKIKAFENHIKGGEVTNYDKARTQFSTTKSFNSILSSRESRKWLSECDAEFDAEERAEIKNLCTFNTKVCLDDWGLSIICKGIVVTLPSCVTALEGVGLNEEEPEIDPHSSDGDIDDLEQLNQKSAALIQKILRQIDIAGSVYTFYVSIALFFTTPIVLFKPSISVRSKRFFCGVNQYTFIVTVLILYWLYEYFYKFLTLPQVQIFFKNMVTDPCFLDGDFIKNRTAIVKDTCKELISMENSWGLIDAKINGAIDVMSKCSIPFRSCMDLTNASYRDDIALTKKFEGCTNAYAASKFIGNETICMDADYSMNEILVADDTGLQWWELWITSGLLATVLVKFSIANFGVALLKLADPFYVCNGSYESPPEVMDLNLSNSDNGSFLDVDNTIKRNKIAALKAIAFRQCLFWGVLSNFSLLTLVITNSSSHVQFKIKDWVVSSIIVFLSLVASLMCFFFSKYSARTISKLQTSTT